MKNIIECLGQAEIRTPKVFLINSHRADQFDFKKMQMSFVETVSDLKRDAMILSLTDHSEDILEKKVEVLRKQIPDAAKSVASFAKHETGEMPKLRPLMEISCLYANQLGISTSSLQIISKNFKKDVSELKAIVNMKIPAILASERNFAKYCTIYGIFLEGTETDEKNAYQHFQIKCESVLKCMLEMCKDESKKLQTKIAIWSHEDTK
ncbi:hypothetical protein DPMN_022340 [Dreissena polymorpha]|uniref:Uncharacterized protein n=1 Tax=Dreissena polymorpha TaxID=45954 RepID=A0A9D4NQE2_DREPO|nr:hypothetical protein DPMN_022340 [Dreissena polymorpha]